MVVADNLETYSGHIHHTDFGEGDHVVQEVAFGLQVDDTGNILVMVVEGTTVVHTQVVRETGSHVEEDSLAAAQPGEVEVHRFGLWLDVTGEVEGHNH